MASIENRSPFTVTVKNRDDLAKTFTFDSKKKARHYYQELETQGFKPKLTQEDTKWVVRVRSVANNTQFLRARTKAEAIALQARIEYEQAQYIMPDYSMAQKTSLADVLIRYLKDELPRLKSYWVEAYKINAMLEDAGLQRQDLAQIITDHKNPHPKNLQTLRKASGHRMGQPSPTSKFIRKPFGSIVPDDFSDYIDERCQLVFPSTVDREIDIFSRVCKLAIDTWRIHVVKNPMDGVRRPKYFNERDRRLKGKEEERFLAAARDEDRKQSIELRLEELMESERSLANNASTIYQRKKVVSTARGQYRSEAQATFKHIPIYETFVQFQLMTGARLSETTSLSWTNIDLDAQTAFLPETKNGRPRKLPLRNDLVVMLRNLPRTEDLVFAISIDALRGAWERMCQHARIEDLRPHDLRHEAISRVAEISSNTPGGFTLLDLQHFSGHRDIRMLLRYSHLCTEGLAKRLDLAFSSEANSGRFRPRASCLVGSPMKHVQRWAAERCSGRSPYAALRVSLRCG